MSNIIQLQRRAIEELNPEEGEPFWPQGIFDSGEIPEEFFFVLPHKYETRSSALDFLEFVGVSVGVGTCSDIHGMNVAVFGYSSGNKPKNVILTKEQKEQLKSCEYCVLLWPYGIIPLETKEANILKHDPMYPMRVVELLVLGDFYQDRKYGKTIQLKRTGKISTYVNLI